ncbi:basic proline-rich protein-like [Ailuropoda melanoleuca]|uniref:basic proline-rich protein-like n=1 Tax=Ailuropoda melanoleuca TaxID=9646 RepID=UPI0014946E74|nr:basic proline-rich protein-like [Ailuropoda melanoleuca]
MKGTIIRESAARRATTVPLGNGTQPRRYSGCFDDSRDEVKEFVSSHTKSTGPGFPTATRAPARHAPRCSPGLGRRAERQVQALPRPPRTRAGSRGAGDAPPGRRPEPPPTALRGPVLPAPCPLPGMRHDDAGAPRGPALGPGFRRRPGPQLGTHPGAARGWGAEPSARCRRCPALRGPGPGVAELGMHRRDGGPNPRQPRSGGPGPARALPPPRDAPRRHAHHPYPPSAAVPSASPPVSPASRLPSRLSAVSPAGGRRDPPPPPPPAPSSASSRVPPASPHPREWPGGSQLAAGPPPRFPAATNGPPPPGSRACPLAVEDRAGARPAGGKGRRAEGGVGPPAPAPRCAAWTCHVGAAAAAVGGC